MSIQIVGIICLLYLGWTTENFAVCSTLARQIASFDETCDKIAQSFPNAIVILQAIRENGGLGHNLSAACASVWQIRPLPPTEIWGPRPKESYSVGHHYV